MLSVHKYVGQTEGLIETEVGRKTKGCGPSRVERPGVGSGQLPWCLKVNVSVVEGGKCCEEDAHECFIAGYRPVVDVVDNFPTTTPSSSLRD
jgi:hypothetical protein